jgi:monoamine oxidase
MPEMLDVAIVGGGVSGAWSGWRLTDPSAGKKRLRRVALFEGSDRIGGRLLSVHFPGQSKVACELGGMRYMSSQSIVKWLVEDELQLPILPLKAGLPENIAYLRGRLLRQGDLGNWENLPYDLPKKERKAPEDLLGDAILRIAPGTKNKSGDALRKAVRTAEYDGRPLWRQGFWNLLAREMSSEAYKFMADSGGYDTTQLNWNAADTIVLNSDFTPTVTYSRLYEGYEQVPIQLAHRFEQQGGAVHLHHWVRAIDVEDRNGDTAVKLTVEDTHSGRAKTVWARRVILAMPRRSLELLGDDGPVLGDAGFRKLLGTVTPIPLFKTFLAYHRGWWEKAGVNEGRSVSDLPLRQTYYWHSDPNAASVLLASYDDTLNVAFWQGLAGRMRNYGDPHGHHAPIDRGPSYGLRTSHLPKGEETRIHASKVNDRWMAHDAPAALVEEMHRQLMELHGVSRAPAPYAAMYHDWAADPFGGGVNFWNIGVRSWTVIPKMLHPVADAPVFVCGEAYSDAQGWVEGALRTAELVLTKHLGLPKLPLPGGGL